MERHQRIRRYTYCYYVYFVASLALSLSFLVVVIAFYFTDRYGQYTIPDLCMPVFLLGMAGYLRMNALHYQQLVLRLTLPARTPVSPKDRRKERRYEG